MKRLKFAILGCGFWSQFQLGAWSEIEGAECVALFNRTKSKADDLAKRFNMPRTYDNVDELFKNEELDFVDIITDVDTHLHFVEKAVEYGVKYIISQKPMAPNYETAKKMVDLCEKAGAKLYIHENYRWQAPVRRFKEILDSGVIGKVFKARVSFLSGFPVFDNQPFLAELDHFILTDMGSHVFDCIRFLFGEVDKLWCQAGAVNRKIKGEDMAAAFLKMESGIPLYTELSYASKMEDDSFSTIWILAEGENGSIALGPHFTIKTTIEDKTTAEVVEFPSYEWADPNYIVNHESGIPLNQNILNDILGKEKAENSGDDNFKTVQLVWAAYESAASGQIIDMNTF